MPTIKHGRGGPDIEGVRLASNTIIEEGDVYNSTSKSWEPAGSMYAGGKVPTGDHVIWVRPNQKQAGVCRTEGKFSPEARAAADAFHAHKKEHPEPIPYEKLTPLQKRMQSGGW